MHPNTHQLPLNAYYTESGAISIRRSPKDKQIEQLQQRLLELESRIQALENGYTNIDR